jgi:transcriptional/translational regulatory protein YebC/TACO1
VAYLFKRLGVLHYAPGTNEEKVMAAAIESGAEDVVTGDDGSIEVLTAPENFAATLDALIRAGLKPEHAEVTQRAAIDVKLAGEDAEKVWKLIETLDELDDVQHVYSNAHFPDEIMQQHAG